MADTTTKTESTALTLAPAPSNNLPVPGVWPAPGVPAVVPEGGDFYAPDGSPAPAPSEAAALPRLPPEVVEAQWLACQDWDKDYSIALRQRWGADGPTNLAFAWGFFRSYPELIEPLSITPGNAEWADHPRLIEAAAILGRLWSRQPGKPETVDRFEQGDRTMTSTPSGRDDPAYQDRLEAIRSQISEAQANGNTTKARRLYQDEMAMIARVEGNAPIVGSQGRTA